MVPNFSDYVVYVDESGDHNLTGANREYPVFVLAFCIFHIGTYTEDVVPAVERLKFNHFGHDMVVFHEREIRKSLPPFDILRDPEVREAFFADLNDVVDSSPFTVTATVIRKHLYPKSGTNPYHVALEFGLERVFLDLQDKGQRGRLTHVIFESRGEAEDKELELEFRRIMDSTRMQGMADTLAFMCVSKKTNSAGLQLADMVARPIGNHCLHPEQANRAWELIEPKLRRSPAGQVTGWGIKTYP